MTDQSTTNETKTASGKGISSDVSSWLECLCSSQTGLTLMPLKSLSKEPKWRKKRLVEVIARRKSQDVVPGGIEEALQWFEQGLNVGVNFLGSRLWAIDIDGFENLPNEVRALLLRADIPQVKTPSGGIHLYLALPTSPEFCPDNLKTHVNHPIINGMKLELDLKFGGNGYTYLVAPESRTPKGVYQPITKWSLPPILDPREVIPEVQIFRPAAEVVAPKKRYDRDIRLLGDRLQAAYAYLRKTPVSMAGERGRFRLWGVLTHLLNYLNIPPKLILSIIRNQQGKSWNDRCLDSKTKQPYPWSETELVEALTICGNMVPAAGVFRRQLRIKDARRDRNLGRMMDLLKEIAAEDGALVPVAEVREIVRKILKLDQSQCTGKRFGDHLRESGIKVVFRGHLNERCVRLKLSTQMAIHKYLEANWKSPPHCFLG